MVVRQKVAVLTSDAQTDERFEAGQSIRMQQIRSAMCAPLWSRDSVIGVIHVDSPIHVGTFTEKDLDLLTALANFAAVAIERARPARARRGGEAHPRRASSATTRRRSSRRSSRTPQATGAREVRADQDRSRSSSPTSSASRPGPRRWLRASLADTADALLHALLRRGLLAGRHDRQVHRRRGDGLLRRADRPARPRGARRRRRR